LPYRNEQNEIVAKVFLPLLAYIFSCEKIPFTDFDKSKSLFNGKPFLKYYIESYQRGKSDFEKGFKLSPDTLYRNPEAYVDTIRYNYFQAKVIGTVTRTENNGWSYWKTATPLIISKEIIAEIGYYSAFIASVWELVEIHPKLFASFDKCELSTPPQQAETKTDKLKVKQIAIIHVYEGLQITRGNAGEIASKHGYTAKNSGEGLFQDYTHYCNPSNRIGKPTPCTPKRLKNKIELFESVVNHLTNSNKQRAIDEINILNTIFDNEYQ
jgi:hypothetical protein